MFIVPSVLLLISVLSAVQAFCGSRWLQHDSFEGGEVTVYPGTVANEYFGQIYEAQGYEYPINIKTVRVFLGSAYETSNEFNFRIYEAGSNLPEPGTLLAVTEAYTLYSHNWNDVDMQSYNITINEGRFVIVLEHRFDYPPALGADRDGITYHNNVMWVNTKKAWEWHYCDDFGVSGDWTIRVEIEGPNVQGPTPTATATQTPSTPTATPTITPTAPTSTPTGTNNTATPTQITSTPTDTPTGAATPTATPSVTCTATAPPNAPYLFDEPEYTAGTSNQVCWSDESSSGAWQYLAQCALDINFNEIASISGWIEGTCHTFSGLDDSVRYYYRVKARDACYWESGYSNRESSIQDAILPEIRLAGYMDTSIGSGIGGHFVLLAYVLDNIGIGNVELLWFKHPTGVYLYDDGTSGDMMAGDGVYSLVVAQVGGDIAPNRYTFELVARDYAGNESLLWPYLNILRGNQYSSADGISYACYTPNWQSIYRQHISSNCSARSSDRPVILFGGYWDTQLIAGGEGLLTLWIGVTDAQGLSDIASVELYFAGSPTGVLLRDDGMFGDVVAGDGIYTMETYIRELAENSYGQFLLEVIATDQQGNQSLPWPYLTIE